MAVFGNFCPKIIFNKSLIVGTKEYKIGKNKGTLVITTFKIDIMEVPFFFFGQKFPKAAIVRWR